jgi:hypothetical protein
MKSNNQNTQCYTIDFEFVPKAKKTFGRNKLDTLGQLGTKNNQSREIEIPGNGSDITDKNVMTAKAKKKLITQKVVLALIDHARKKDNEEFMKSLWNTYHCLNKVIVSDKKLHGKYCKNRICTVCNGIRKAEMINRFLPTVQSWEDPYFVTLTAKSCYANKLYYRMRNTKRALKKIEGRMKKRYLRGKGPKLVAIKSLECNFNPNKRWYNPHFHILVPNKELAEILKREWLSTWTGKYTSLDGQKLREVKDTERDLIEVIKYGSKILTEPNPRNKSKRNKITRRVYIAALYNILYAMKGLRLVDTCGFKLPKEKNKSVSNTTLIEYQKLSYESEIMDWVDKETGETLSGYTPSLELINILNNRIDTSLQ